MKVQLLYPDKEWVGVKKYSDFKNITQDLGLKTLYNTASKVVVREDGKVKKIMDSDMFIQDVFSKVMTVPLQNSDEVYYRQEILKDCLEREDFIIKLYNLVTAVLTEWDKLGRKDMEKKGGTNDAGSLVFRIHTLNLFVSGLEEIEQLIDENSFSSRGLCSFAEGLKKDYFAEKRGMITKLLDSIRFYISDSSDDGSGKMVAKPRMVMRCNVGGGLKLENMVLEETGTKQEKFRKPNGTLTKLRDYMTFISTDAIQLNADPTLQQQGRELEFSCVKYMISFLEPFFEETGYFFDQLRFQAAFYRGAVNLRHHMERFYLKFCYPRVSEGQKIEFEELKEFVMCIEQRVNAVGNKCDLSDKNLVIITGANQGGKSTFLRSIGIAQVMLQCGLFVTATSYTGGLFPNLFTHFTRREDSAMNSGRLDEELGRMSQIVDNIGPASLVLLNESFATTTELEGSNIAYDIIKALTEAGVRIITVTHLLTFAQRIYAECEENKKKYDDIIFFCAERLEDGRRTFRMIQSVPEMTSFGLDLYEDIIECRQN